MAIELQSAKFFPGYFDEENTAIAPESNTGQPASPPTDQPAVPATAAPAQSSVAAPLFQANPSKWTVMMTVVAGLCALMGLYGTLGGLWGLASLANLENSRMALDQVAQTEEVIFAKSFIDSQQSMLPFLYACSGFRALVGIGFLAAAAKMFKRSPAANEFVATVCTGAIIYHLSTAVLTWLAVPSLQGLGLNAEAAQMAGNFMVAAMVVSFLFNSAIHIAIITYMYGGNNKNYFAPQQSLA